jgi:CubicO group peptidase (beta-lactamase class C family)
MLCRDILSKREENMMVSIRAGLSAFALIVGLGAAAPDAVAQQTPAVPKLDEASQKKIDWVRENREEFFFWNRFEDLLANPQEFPKPATFYNPNVLVEGSEQGPLPKADPKARTISEETWKKVTDWAMPRNTYALAVMRNGKVEYETWADGYWDGRMLPVRSFTKTLPSLLIGVAIGEGKIKSIDEPVENYLTEWKGDARGKITIRQFLTMSSGIEGLGRTTGISPTGKVVGLTEGADVYEAAFRFEKTAEPDTVFGLNQVDSQILGMVLERATGKPFAEYLSEKIWRPIGGGTATLNVDAKGQARTLCCMRASLMDFLRVGRMIADEGRWNGKQIVPESYIKEMLTPSKVNPYKGLHIWLGWKPGTAEVKQANGGPLQMPAKQPYAIDDIAYMMGGGFMNVWISPSTDLVILRWGFEPSKELGWDNTVIPNLILADVMKKR